MDRSLDEIISARPVWLTPLEFLRMPALFADICWSIISRNNNRVVEDAVDETTAATMLHAMVWKRLVKQEFESCRFYQSLITVSNNSLRSSSFFFLAPLHPPHSPRHEVIFFSLKEKNIYIFQSSKLSLAVWPCGIEMAGMQLTGKSTEMNNDRRWTKKKKIATSTFDLQLTFVLLF